MSLELISRNLPLTASRYIVQRTEPEALRGGQSPVFMRVRRTAPMFTFNLPERFVNVKSPISTDICGVSLKLFPYRPISANSHTCALEERPLRHPLARILKDVRFPL